MGCYVWISFPLCVLLVICVHPERNCFCPALLVVRHRMDDSNCSVCLISSWGFGLTEQGLGLCLQCHCLKGSASLEVRAQLFPVTVNNCNMSATESSLHLFPLRSFTLSIFFFFLHSYRGPATPSGCDFSCLAKGCSLVVKMDSIHLFSK